MEHPFVVCHMLTSLDGKIDGTFFGVPETVPAKKPMGNCEVFTDVRPPYTAQLPCWGDMPRERWGSYPL